MSKDRNVMEDRVRETTTTREVEKLERTPLYKQRTSDVYCFKEPGYRYRLVNDVYGRISRFIAAGWTIVEDNITQTFSEKNNSQRAQSSSGAWRVVNQGNDAKSKDGVIMRIPLELWEQDQAAKQVECDSAIDDIDHDGLIKRNLLMGSRSNAPRDIKK